MSFDVEYADDYDVTDLVVWWDPAETLASVLWTLRLHDGDVDEEAVAALIPAAACKVQDYIDPIETINGPPPIPAIQAALEATTIALYHRGGANATVGASVSTFTGTDDPFDPIRDVRAELVAHKEQWGIG